MVIIIILINKYENNSYHSKLNLQATNSTAWIIVYAIQMMKLFTATTAVVKR